MRPSWLMLIVLGALLIAMVMFRPPLRSESPALVVLILLLMAVSTSTVVIPAVGSIQQIIAGHYADGTPRVWYFILTGQTNTIAAALVYIAATGVFCMDFKNG